MPFHHSVPLSAASLSTSTVPTRSPSPPPRRNRKQSFPRRRKPLQCLKVTPTSKELLHSHKKTQVLSLSLSLSMSDSASVFGFLLIKKKMLALAFLLLKILLIQWLSLQSNLNSYKKISLFSLKV